MVLDPRMGFVIVHESSGLAPGAERAGGEVQIVRPKRSAMIYGDLSKNGFVAERLENRPTIQKRGKIDLACEPVAKRDAHPVTANSLDGRDSISKISVHSLNGEVRFCGVCSQL